MSSGVITVLVVFALVVFALARGRDGKVEMPAAGGRGRGTIEEALAAGRKIEAIKLYRVEHGVGLREAKDAIEELERSLPTP